MINKQKLIEKDYVLYLIDYFGNMQTWEQEDILAEIARKVKEAKPVSQPPAVGIDKQKLIEEFTKWRDAFDFFDDEGHILMESVIEEIKSQPQVHVPDTNDGEYIKLADLLDYPIRLNNYDKVNGDIKFVYGVESVLEFAEGLDRYAQPQADQWITCSVAVPSNIDPSVYDDIVIKRASGKTVNGCCWSDYPRWWGENDGDWFEIHDAIAWMPLPEPYKEESK